MTPPIPLIDHQLERMLVAAVLVDPACLVEIADLGAVDLGDFQAQVTFTAIRNLQARGDALDVERVRAELLSTGCAGAERQPDGWPPSWFDKLVDISLPARPPVPIWATTIMELAAARLALIGEADAELQQEARRRKPPPGPRAENTEPVRLAEAFRRYLYEQDDEPTLVRWARAWWRYDRTHYVEHDDESLDRDIIKFLDVVVAPQAVKGSDLPALRRVTSRQKTIGEVRKSCLHTFPLVGSGAPQWTSPVDGDRDARQIVACANGILDLRTLELLPATPRFFTTTSIGAAWDPAAEAPGWLAFLDSLWGEDTESIRTLQQMFGYLLTPDTSQQKMFMLQGQKRCGKGTIARVLRALLSPGAVAHPTLESLEGQFGLAPLVGKTLATIGDARLGGSADQSKIVERLLSISGEDALSINRKNRDAIDVRLTARVLLLSNELPRLYDTSGALASRFVILVLGKSFLGREDTGLERRLLAELPGIFRWAVEGYQDLQEHGRFIQPLASEVAIGHMQALSSPMTVFLDECCVLAPEAEVEIDALYTRFVEWCKANGRDRPVNKQWFGRDLNTLHPEIEQSRPRRPNGTRVRVYQGIRIATLADTQIGQ